jgi:hypothetical protein
MMNKKAKQMKLLTIQADSKTVKGESKGYLTAIMYLAPWKLSGYQVCPMAEIAGCVGDCLNTAGRGGMARADADTIEIDGHVVKLNAIQKARIARTRFFFEDRAGFMAQLIKEISAARKKATKMGLTLVVRLNGTSDIRWESVSAYQQKADRIGYATIFDVFSDIQFYDYTKIANRDIKHVPNYHLTFSVSARKEFYPFWLKAQENYGRRMNYAVVFKGKTLPTGYAGYPVINGDESDLRFLDRKGVVVGLKAKGQAKKSNSGFAVEAA